MQNSGSELFGVPRKKYPLKNSVYVNNYFGSGASVEFSNALGSTVSGLNFDPDSLVQKGAGIQYFSGSQGRADCDTFTVDTAGTYTMTYTTMAFGTGTVNWTGSIMCMARNKIVQPAQFFSKVSGIACSATGTIYLDAGSKVIVYVNPGSVEGTTATYTVMSFTLAQVA